MTNLVQPEVPAVMGGERGPAGAGAGGEPLPLRWLLFALVVVAWFPLTPWWQSDDFLALHHAADARRALADFTGNQYGLEGVVWFYRPLITLSFFVEQALAGGPSALVAHLSNVLAHALSAVLVGMLGARFLGAVRGWLAGLLWALAPAHVGAVAWAVGRVDSHTMVWTALACVLFVRFVDGRAHNRVPTMAALALALCSKESALVVPGFLVLLGCCAARRGSRLRSAFAAWPAFVLVALYLGMRFRLFGRVLGGYEAATFDPTVAVPGLGQFALTLVDPLRGVSSRLADLQLPAPIVWVGMVPFAIAVVIALVRGRIGLLTASAVGFVGAALPALQFWSQSGDPASLRYFYVAFVAVAFVVAAAGVVPSMLMLVVFALPLFDARGAWIDAQGTTGMIHRQLIEDAKSLPSGRVFVAGLPRQSARHGVVQFHLGVDRLLDAPFVAEPRHRVFALRPLDPRADVILIPYGDDRGLPFDAPTIRIEDATIRAQLPRATTPDCRVELEGLGSIATSDLPGLDDRSRLARIVVRDLVAPTYRVTLFTAGGYVSAVLPNRADGGARDGAIDVRDLLFARYVTTAATDQAHVAFALAVATTLDLEPVFPVLVEVLDGARVTHANRIPLELRFDRALYRFIHPD